MRVYAWVVAAALGAGMCGCQMTHGSAAGGSAGEAAVAQDDGTLLALLASTSTPEESRKGADRALVARKSKTDAARLAVLEQMLYAPRHSDAMRIYAMDQLAEADPARAGAALKLYLPRMEPGDVLVHACGVCAALGDERLIEALARSMDRAVGNPNLSAEKLRARAEWDAIEKLSGGGGDGKAAVESLYRLVERGEDRSARIASLDVLGIVDGREEVAGRLQKMTREDGWLRDVRWWVAMFGVAPVGETESVWMEYLHRPAQAAMVARALERHRRLKSDSDYMFAPRFVGTLAYVSDEDVGKTRGALLSDLGRQLATLHAAAEGEGSLAADESKLSRGDLLAIWLLLNKLIQPAIVEELHRQGMEDLSDTTTAHGGLFATQYVDFATLFPPLSAESDLDYVPSQALIQQTAAGVAEYHFAFQRVRNGELAMPTDGELARAREEHCNSVKITSVDTRKMRIVFYTTNRGIVDLGVYEVK